MMTDENRKKQTVVVLAVAVLICILGTVMMFLNNAPETVTGRTTTTTAITTTVTTTTATMTTATMTTATTATTAVTDTPKGVKLLEEVIVYSEKTVTVDAVAVRNNCGEICDYLSKGSVFWTDLTQYQGTLHIYYWSEGIRDGWISIMDGWWE